MFKPKFNKKVAGKIKNPIGEFFMNTFHTVGDINNDGLKDIVLCGRNGKMAWFENKGKKGEFIKHVVDQVQNMECGGSLYDITGNGYLDIINGSDSKFDEIYWWENPGEDGDEWEKRLIAKTDFRQFHDTTIGKIKNDGKDYLVFTNQKGKNSGTNIYCVPFPKDPKQTPWPELEVIAEGKKGVNPFNDNGYQPEEGLAIGDIDGDGKNELIGGTHWYKFDKGEWNSYKFAKGYITTKNQIGDIDGDGNNEIILSEGDECSAGKEGCKLAWFEPKNDIKDIWEEHVIKEDLLDAHTLQLGDINNNGNIDILVGEIGLNNDEREYIIRDPQIMIFENDGKGNFTPHIIDKGTGIHDGLLIDMNNNGTLDIVGKPLHGEEIWNIHVYYNESI